MYIREYGKRACAIVLCAATLFAMTACGKTSEEAEEGGATGISFESLENLPTEEVSEPEAEPQESDEPYVLPEGMYFSGV